MIHSARSPFADSNIAMMLRVLNRIEDRLENEICASKLLIDGFRHVGTLSASNGEDLVGLLECLSVGG